MLTGYRYMTLWYEESPSSSEAVPFGVIVETRRFVYYLGFDLAGDAASVTGQIISNFADVLRERIPAVSQEARRRDSHVVDLLRKELSWNVRAEKPVHRLWGGFRRPEDLGEQLFKQNVEARSPSMPNAVRVGDRPRWLEFDIATAAFVPATT